MKDDTTKPWQIPNFIWLFAVPGFVAFIAATSILRGWVLAKLWGWFVMPQFGWAALSIPSAIGLCMVAEHIHGHSPGKLRDKDKGIVLERTPDWFGMVATPFIALFMGWIVTHWL